MLEGKNRRRDADILIFIFSFSYLFTNERANLTLIGQAHDQPFKAG